MKVKSKSTYPTSRTIVTPKRRHKSKIVKKQAKGKLIDSNIIDLVDLSPAKNR